MNTPTYEQQWQKITEAYMRDEIDPMECEACFVGNLLNGYSDWSDASWYLDNPFAKKRNRFKMAVKKIRSFGYTPFQINKIEDAFLNGIHADEESPDYEEDIFNGMTAALEILRQIHAAKGDITAIEIPLQKRQLVNS